MPALNRKKIDNSAVMTDHDRRNASLDLFKSFLVVGMVCAHTLQLATVEMSFVGQALSFYINLITFSGFVFAYGFGIGLSSEARSGGQKRTWKRVGKIYGAYLISSLSFLVLVEPQSLTLRRVLQIGTMSRLEGYSEFIASFVVLSLIAGFFRPVLHFIASSYRNGAVVAVLSCLSTFLVVSSDSVPLLGTLISSDSFPNFPVVPYGVWLIAGMFCARLNQPNLAVAVLSGFGTLAFVVWTARSGLPPSRFPPSWLWIIGSSLPLIAYWTVSRALVRTRLGRRYVALPGRHTLSILIVSNISLFAIHNIGRLAIGTASAIGIGLMLTIMVTTVKQFTRGNSGVKLRPEDRLGPD